MGTQGGINRNSVLTCVKMGALGRALHRLNDEQRAAVLTPHSKPLLVLAGPGCGKTKMIVSRESTRLRGTIEPQLMPLSAQEWRTW